MLKIGDFELYLINDASYWVDPGGAFGLVPRKLWVTQFQPNADQLIPMTQTCLLIKAHGKIIVVDTGFGEKLDERARRIWTMERDGGLRRGLAQLGITPDAVDLVINTHLHSDHAGGNTLWRDQPNGDVVPMFPNAEYVVQRREYDDAMQPNERTRAAYHLFNYAPLVASGQMRLLDGDTEFFAGISGIVTAGHTPGHMSVRIESLGEHAAFVCDLASYAVHFERLGWMTAYDVEPLRTLETKRIWQHWAIDTRATLIFPHDGLRPAGKLVESDGVTKLIKSDEALIEA